MKNRALVLALALAACGGSKTAAPEQPVMGDATTVAAEPDIAPDAGHVVLFGAGCDVLYRTCHVPAVPYDVVNLAYMTPGGGYQLNANGIKATFGTQILNSSTANTGILLSYNEGDGQQRLGNSTEFTWDPGTKEFRVYDTINPLLDLTTTSLAIAPATGIGEPAFTGVTLSLDEPTTGTANPGVINAATENLSGVTSYSTGDYELATGNTVTLAAGDAPTVASVINLAPVGRTFASASGAQVIADAASVVIGAAPIPGALMTLTRTEALWVQTGLSRFDGNAQVTGQLAVNTAPVANGTAARIVQATGASGTPSIASFTAGALTGITATVEDISVYFNLGAQTKTWAAGTVTSQNDIEINPSTYLGSGGTATFTTASTFTIDGPPVASTNAVFTNPARALWVAAGLTALDGPVRTSGLTGAGTTVVTIDGSGNLGTSASATVAGSYLGTTVETSGTTFTTTANTHTLHVRMVGGGGAGGGCTSVASAVGAGAGGGAGGYIEWTVAVTPSTAYTYAIGAGGAGVSGGAGNNGTNTTLTVGAITVTATKGSGGTVGTSTITPPSTALGGTGGLPVSAGGSPTNIVLALGPAGEPGLGLSVTGPVGVGGAGGSTLFGGGSGAITTAANGSGQAANSYGGGGGGALTGSSSVRTGGNGGPGVIIFDEYR